MNTEGLIVYCQNRYSVPWRYIGLTLPVRITEEEIIIYGPQIEEIARHRLLSRQASGETVRSGSTNRPMTARRSTRFSRSVIRSWARRPAASSRA